jgi:antirestriction protein ArdC
MGEKTDAYQIITDRICTILERGEIPWRRPWSQEHAMPQNLVSRKEYRGINPLILSCAGYVQPYWLTYKQAKTLGGEVRKGEHGFPVVFWKWLDGKDRETGERKRIPLLRYYTVFNVGQCDGLDEKVPARPAPNPIPQIERCEAVIAGYKTPPKIRTGEDRAYYRPSTDLVNMPPRETFRDAESYYSVLFHELGHSTGHADRLKRQGITDTVMFGSHDYSKEELVAEMTAAFLSGHCGIDSITVENSAAYIKSWLKSLRNDKSLLVSAAAQAQKAADHILGRTFDKQADE